MEQGCESKKSDSGLLCSIIALLYTLWRPSSAIPLSKRLIAPRLGQTPPLGSHLGLLAFYSAKVTSSSLLWCLHLLFSLTGMPSPQISTWLSSLFHSHLCSNVTLTERACPSSFPGNLPPAQRMTSGFPSPSPAHSELSLSRAGSVSSRGQ